MGKVINLIGQKFGNLTVLEDTGERKNRQVVWKCQCDCGNITQVVGGSLRSGHTKSCGCLSKEGGKKNVLDITGITFGKLTVIERAGSNSNRHALWKCKCRCGAEIIADGCELRKGSQIACWNCTMSLKYFNSEDYKDVLGKQFGRLTAIEPIKERNNAGRVIWKCKCECGNPNYVYVAASSLKSGNTSSCGCLTSAFSIGEETIEKLLQNHNINYQKQIIFNDLISPKGGFLRYDFGIYQDNKLIKLIEFDGIQHFQAIDRFGGREEFEYLQQCDNIKNNYAHKINIPLIRIPYTHKNLITIIDLIGDKYLV